MNVIFFLLPLLIFTSIPLVYGETITGPNYFDIINPDGTHTWKSHEPYVFDGNNWVPYIASGTTIQTDLATVTLNADGTFSWNNKFTDNIIAKYSDVSDQVNWVYPNTWNNDTPDISWDGNQLVSSKVKSGIGQLDYKYILDNGKWKTQLEATNLSGLNTKVFGFDQVVDLESDMIKFGGITRNLDNFKGVTFDKQFLINNQGKVIDLLNGINFDFDLGFENLYSITVYDTGVNKSRLVFDYRTSEILLPGQTLTIDPTFTGTPISEGRVYSTSATGAACPTTFSTSDGNMIVLKSPSAANSNCQAVFFNFNATTIPIGVTVNSASLEYDITTAYADPINCDYKHMAFTAAGDEATYDALTQDVGSVVDILQNDSTCTGAAADGYIVNFNTGSYQTLFENDIDGDGIVSLGIFYTDVVRDATTPRIDFRSGDVVLTIVYTEIPRPDPVDDLTSPSQSYGTVDLSWTQPGLNGETCQGYQINYTTPYGNPLTIITNNTNTCTTSTSVTGLGTGTPYTFGVSVWTAGGNNATHPPMTWYNITTGGNFTIGTAVFNQTNPFVLPITFEEQTINATAEFLNVTFSNTFNLACDFHYKFANTNQTYTNLTSYAVSSTLDEASFVFTNGTNEIIDVYCWDQITDTNARYLIKQTDFPILDQILGFRNGDYGTEGMFGVFDLVTLLVIIGSMIGLNRENESVGIVFNVMLMFSLSFFGIIELTTVIFGMIALVLVFVITSTKKS